MNNLNILVSPKSTMPRNIDTRKVKITTIDVEVKACFGVGHTTFLSSIFASFKNCLIFCILFIDAYSEFISVTIKMAGQEGVEPPASGFGVRRSIQLELLARTRIWDLP